MRTESWCGHDIRFVEVNGEWYAILKDICDALRLRSKNISQRLDPDMMERVCVDASEDGSNGIRSRGENKTRYNDTLKLVRKTGNLYPNFIVASRQSGKTNIQLKYLEEMMKKWNRGIVNNNQSIKNVIFNNPATIVFWNDGTKTVVKAENEPFDPEKGLAMAIAKKSLGNKGDYYNEFKKWLPDEKAKWKDPSEKVCSSCKHFSLSPSSARVCLECMKDETLPNWEKKDTLPKEEEVALPDSVFSGSEDKLCSKCKYADVPLFYKPCVHCYGNDRIMWEKADE